MSWQLALFFNVIFATIRSTIEKKLVDRLDPLVVFFHTAFWSTVFFTLFYLLRHDSLPIIYPEMILFGVSVVLITGSYLAAIKISLSQTVVFGSYYIVVAMLLTTLFLGEWQLFDPAKISGQKTLIGVFLAFISLVFLLKSSSRKEAIMEQKWVFLIAVVIILNGVITFWSKSFLASHGPLETLISQSFSAQEFGAFMVKSCFNVFGWVDDCFCSDIFLSSA